MRVTARAAGEADTAAIAAIYNEGIADRVATFVTEPRDADEVRRWLAGGRPLVVVCAPGGDVVGWASAAPYRPGRPFYAGVAEFSVYVARASRGQGTGRAAMEALVAAAERRGLWKLVGRIFPENRASLALCAALGFREVGVYRRHGRLDGAWCDCVIVELLLGEAAVD